jgi:phytoene synthase
MTEDCETVPNTTDVAAPTGADNLGHAPATLVASYAACRNVARRSSSSFYYSFFLLPRPERDAMCALYAFLRRTDDLGDSAEPLETRRAALADWRDQFVAALDGRGADPLLPALADTALRFRVPRRYLEDAISGVEMDLRRQTYDTWEEVEDYCYHVASVVGLACIHIWGFTDAAALAPARTCGLAFQWTNILRDLKEDAARGRCYIPREDLARFGCDAADLADGRSPAVRELMRFELARAEQFYVEAAELGRWLKPEGKRIYRAMVATYHALLDEIKRRDCDVWSRPLRLGRWRKLAIAAGSLFSR